MLVVLKITGHLFPWHWKRRELNSSDELVPAHILSEALCCGIRTWEPGGLLRQATHCLQNFPEKQNCSDHTNDIQTQSSLLMGTPSSLPIPSDLQIIFPQETSLWQERRRSLRLSASSEGTWDTALALKEAAEWAGSLQVEVLRGLCIIFLTFRSYWCSGVGEEEASGTRVH